jgi:hypothetical protein
MTRPRLPRLTQQAMSNFSTDDQANALSSSKNEKTPTFAAEQQQQEDHGANITLPLSIGHPISNQGSETEGTVSIKRYMDLQDEYSKLAKRYRFMHDEFAEMRIELVRLRQEREEAWRRKK